MRIIACLASTLDGKIAPPPSFPYERFSSDADIRRLKELRDTADAILIGGETFRTYPKICRGFRTDRQGPRHCILTRGENLLKALPPDSPLFSEDAGNKNGDKNDVPVTIFIPTLPSEEERKHYPSERVSWVAVGHDAEDQVAAILSALEKQNIKTLMIEGGAQLTALFIKTGKLQEFYLTLCPLLFGETARADLIGALNLPISNSPRFKILELVQEGDEIFLHLALQNT